MSVKVKQFLISAVIVLIMLFWVDPSVVNWLWSAFPPSVAEWGKVIRFLLWIPVLIISFWVTLFTVGIFLTASTAAENKKRIEAFRKKHNFPKKW